LNVIFATSPSAVAVTPSPTKLIDVNVVPIPTPSSLTSNPDNDVLISSPIISISAALTQSMPFTVDANI
jgi:hypothetical protein